MKGRKFIEWQGETWYSWRERRDMVQLKERKKDGENDASEFLLVCVK